MTRFVLTESQKAELVEIVAGFLPAVVSENADPDAPLELWLELVAWSEKYVLAEVPR